MMSNMLYKIKRKCIHTPALVFFPLFIFTVFNFSGDVYASGIASCTKGKSEIFLICSRAKGYPWAPKDGFYWGLLVERPDIPKPVMYKACTKDTPVIDNIHFSTNPEPSLNEISKKTPWKCKIVY